MSATSKARLAALILSDAQRFAALKREIVQLDYFCQGTVLKRMMKCGHKQCACHRDPAKRHGPYLECTYKVHNKTINLKLYPEVAPRYRTAIQQYRQLKSLLGRLERLSPTALAHRAQQVQSQRRN
jgi:Family of unknown function (DUF6788)